MQPKLLKYILDIESVIEEIESIKQKTQNDFNNFSSDIIFQRAVERDLEIIGEAIRRVIELKPNVHITASKNIIYWIKKYDFTRLRFGRTRNIVGNNSEKYSNFSRRNPEIERGIGP